MFLTVLFSALLATSALGQAQDDAWRIWLKTGERYTGQLVAITDDMVLMELDGDVRGFQRSDILYMKGNQSIRVYGKASPRDREREERYVPRVPLDKLFENEVEAGLGIGSPFAVRVGYNKWYTKYDHWHYGLGLNAQVYRFSQIQLAGAVRRYWWMNKFNSAFLEGSAGISIYQAVNGVNFRDWMGWSFIPEEYDSQFFPVKQAGFGTGYRFDPGIGVAFVSKLKLEMTWYRLNEQPNPNTFIEGRYFLATVGISGSFIF